MRQIKFRAWSTENKKMYPVDEFTCNWNRNFMTKTSELVIKSTNILMQFTGLLDCEGKEVWEGQIVDNDYLVVFLLGKFQLKSLSNNTYQDIYDNQHKVTGEYYKMEEN